MDSSRVLYSVENGIARLTLNRSEKRNALNADIIGELGSALHTSAGDESVRIVLLTGAGADFCSGADLSATQEKARAGALENLADAQKLADIFFAIRQHPRPVVAAVRGRALAGGCGLATACDLIVASESARFGYPEVNIGFVPAMVMAILRRSVSEKHAFEMITGGEIISSQIAADYGLINRVFADETFDVDVEAYVHRLAAKPPGAVALSKRLLYHTDAMGYMEAVQAGVYTNALARTTEEFEKGVAAFLNKTGRQ